jgi:hypothetical protein
MAVNTLFRGDLLNFGTIIILVMIVGGAVVALTMFAESAWQMRRRRQDRENDAIAETTEQASEPQIAKSA